MELGPPFQFHLFDEPVQIIRLITTTYKQTPEICLIDFLASSQVFTVKFEIDSTEFDDLIELWLAHIEPEDIASHFPLLDTVHSLIHEPLYLPTKSLN